MKVELSSIAECIELQCNEAQSYLNKVSGEVITITDEEMQLAESKEDTSEYPDWMKEPINIATKYLGNKGDYLDLPTDYGFNEYGVMEDFILTLPEEQKNEMYFLIKGTGAFSKFRAGLERFSLTDKWYEFKDIELNKFVKTWCEDNNIEIK